MSAKRTSIYLDDKDVEAIEAIQEKYGLVSLSDAVRFALRMMARSELKLVVSGEERSEGECGDLA